MLRITISTLLFIVTYALNAQSVGGFGFRRFATTTTLNNVSVSNIDNSASRNAYVHSNGIYYVWDGNSWEREEDIDTFDISGAVVSISLYGDGVPNKTINIQESVEDIAGGMVTGNTETGITVTYDDASGKFNFVTTDQSATNEIQQIDTFSISGSTVSLSLSSDGVPAKTITISGVGGTTDSTWVKINGSYANKRTTDAVYRTGPTGYRTTDTTGVVNFSLPNSSSKSAINFSGTTNYLFTTSRPTTTTHSISNVTFVNRVFPSASIAGDNQVLALGFNNAPGGGLVNSSRAAASYRLEENYTNSLSDTSGNYEAHLPHIEYPNGTNVRPLTGYFSNESIAKGGYWQFNSDVLLFHDFASTQKGWLSVDSKLSYQKGLTFLDTATIVLYKSAIAGIEGRNAANTAFIKIIKTDSNDRIVIGGQNETRVAAYNILQVTNGGYVYNENGTVTIGNSTYSRSNLLIDGFSTLVLGMKTSTQTSPWYHRLYDTHYVIRTPAGNDAFDLHEDLPAATIATNSSGDVGLLTASPQARLHVNTSNGATQKMVRLQNSVETVDQFVSNATPESAISASPGSFAYTEISSTGRWFGKATGTGNTGWVEFYHTGNLPSTTTLYTGDGTIGTNRVAAITDNLAFANNSAATGERFVVTYDNGISSTNFFQVKEGTGITLQSSQNRISLEGATGLTDMLSPTTIASSQNNYTGLDGGNFGRLDASTAVDITGFSGGFSGRILPFVNISSTAITLKDQSASSNSQNRIELPSDIRLNQNDAAFLIYDSLTTRWRLLATNIGSPYTSSGRLLNGRSGNLYMQYMTDTLNDFALGYFTNGTTDDKTTFGKFGLHIDGAGGFGVGGKETYLKGSSFDLTTTSYVASQDNAYVFESRSRGSVGGVQNESILYGTTTSAGVTANRWEINHAHDNYQGLKIGSYKYLSSTPSSRYDYNFVYQGGGETGTDTTALSMWLGVPQFVDTIETSGIRAVSKERGWGVQSLWDATAGVRTTQAYDWIKIRTGVSLSDTTADAIRLYNNSYEFPNARPSSSAGDTSVMIWTGPFTSQFIDIDDIKGGGGAGGTNIYNSNGTTSDNTRNVTITETLNFIGTADVGLDPYPFQIKVTGNEPLIQLWKGNTDSTWIKQSDVEYLFGSSARLVVESTDDLIVSAGDGVSVVGDSISLTGVEAKTKVRNLLGLVGDGFAVKRIDGDAASDGDLMVSNGTDFVLTNVSTLNASRYTSSPSTDQTASGSTTTFTANENQGFGDVVQIGSDGDATLADADAIATSSGIALCTGTVTTGNTGTYLLEGFARNDSWNWTVGGLIYLSTSGTTGNTLTQTAPSGTNDVVQILGVATHADRILFKPQLVQIERN